MSLPCASLCSSKQIGSVRRSQPKCQGRQRLLVKSSLTADRQSLDLNKMTPLSDRVLVKPIVEETVTSSGIYLPKPPPKTNSDAHFGEVVAVGPKVEVEVKAGDKIVFQKYATAEVEIPEGEVMFVAEKSIIGVLTQ